MKRAFLLFTIIILCMSAGEIRAAEIVAPNGAKPIPGVTTSWLGNTYGGMRDGKEAFVMHDIAAIHVTPDGTIYTNVLWEEGGANCSMFKDGEFLGSAHHTHGWGRNGGKAVCANSKYVFIGLSGNNEGGGLKDPDTFPPKGFQWYGVSRRLRSDFTKAAPFEDGKGRTGSGDVLDHDFLVVNEIPLDEQKQGDDLHNIGSVAGMCADDQRLYLSNPYKKTIEVYDAETMKKIATWDLADYAKYIMPFREPGQMQMDADGNIWCHFTIYAVAADQWKDERTSPRNEMRTFSYFVQFNSDGKNLASISFENLSKVESAFCFGKDHTLYYVDPQGVIAVSSELRKMQNETERSFGEFPANFLPKNMKKMQHPWGEFGDLRFLGRIAALGVDGEGNLIIAQDLASAGGGNILESYKLGGEKPTLNWRLFGLCFIDCATLDPADETMIYTKEEIFKADWAKGPGQEATFLGLTHGDREEDFRFRVANSAGSWVRNVNGHKLLYVNDMDDRLLQIYSLPDNSDFKPGQTEVKKPHLVALFANTYKEFNRVTKQEIADRPNDETALVYYAKDRVIYPADQKPEPPAQGWWVDADANLWRVTETEGIRVYPVKFKENGEPTYDFDGVRTFPHPAEFTHVKRVRYDVATDTLYLGGCTEEHKNQHWKPMGPVVCRYDNFLKGENPGQTAGKLRWKTVLPYAKGSQWHFSFEPMGFDIAGEYMFLPYTGETRDPDYRYGHVEVIRLDDATSVGYMEPDPATVGIIGLQDIRESLSAHQLKSGEYVIFMEDDYKAKVLIYRLRLGK